MKRPSCLIKVPSSLDDGTFFRWWIRFLSPFHSLTAREMEVTAALFHHRYELSKSVTDPLILDKLVLDDESRKTVSARMGISRNYMKLILVKLRKNNIIKDGRLNPKFIPDISMNEDKSSFSILIVFDFNAKRKEEKV